MKSKNLTIKYFALLREQAQKSEENFVTDATSAIELYEELAKIYGFSLSSSHVKVSINDAFEDLRSELKDGDVIVFIPPVAGG